METKTILKYININNEIPAKKVVPKRKVDILPPLIQICLFIPLLCM